jgi:hypothetical protein
VSELWTSDCVYMTGVGWDKRSFSFSFFLIEASCLCCLLFLCKKSGAEEGGFLLNFGVLGKKHCIANGHVWRRRR